MPEDYFKVGESKTLAINTLSKSMELQGRKIYKFGFGQSPFNPPQNAIDAFAKNVGLTNYSHVQGNIELRERIAHFHKQANGIDTSADDVLVAPGSKILIYSILLAIKNLDVFVPAPSWVSYRPQVELCQHHLINVTTNFEERWRVTPAGLRAAFKKKKRKNSILILNYPGNPDGLSYTENELKALAKTLRELNILVISDEIYALLNFNQSHHSLATFYPEGTITTTGLSKWCGAGGWRLGIALLGKNMDPLFKKALIGIASETYSCTSEPVQMAAIKAYEDFSKTETYLQQQIEILKTVGNFCHRELDKIGIRVHPPEGGFYLFPDFSNFQGKLNAKGIFTADQLCEQLLNETGVALLPGSAFGLKKEILAARLAYVDFDDPIGKAGQFEYKFPRIVAGMEALVAFFKD